jgi:hypothetical protein
MYSFFGTSAESVMDEESDGREVGVESATHAVA